MMNLYLSIHLAIVVALLIRALRIRETDPPVGQPCGTARPAEEGAGSPVAARCRHDRAPLPNSALELPPDRRPFHDLQATLSASYTARLEQAIRTIQVGTPARTRPTDEAAG